MGGIGARGHGERHPNGGLGLEGGKREGEECRRLLGKVVGAGVWLGWIGVEFWAFGNWVQLNVHEGLSEVKKSNFSLWMKS